MTMMTAMVPWTPCRQLNVSGKAVRSGRMHEAVHSPVFYIVYYESLRLSQYGWPCGPPGGRLSMMEVYYESLRLSQHGWPCSPVDIICSSCRADLRDSRLLTSAYHAEWRLWNSSSRRPCCGSQISLPARIHLRPVLPYSAP